MIKPALIPTRLIQPDEREPISIVDVPRPPRLRSLQLLVRFARLITALLSLVARRNLTPQLAGQRVRELFEGLGGLWIKAGQLLSLRVDLFPTEFCQEL